MILLKFSKYLLRTLNQLVGGSTPPWPTKNSKALRLFARPFPCLAGVSRLAEMKMRHSGFNVFCGPRIQPGDEEAMENLARYIVRASFSQERMSYISEESKVVYQSKDGKEEKVFDALEWLAAMCSHVPNKGEQNGQILWSLQQCQSR